MCAWLLNKILAEQANLSEGLPLEKIDKIHFVRSISKDPLKPLEHWSQRALNMEEIATGDEGGFKDRLLKLHAEKHFTAGEMVRDVIMGMSDGLTVPFALAAGLSGADVSSSIILTAGLAEVAAGAISMGLGGYLAAKSEADHYMREQRREQEEIVSVPETEASEVADILAQYGLEPYEYWPVVNALRKRPEAWLEFMMRFELGLEKPDPRRAVQSALTIAIAYVIGGLVPLIPYMFIRVAKKAVLISIIVTLISLLFFGYFKGRFVGNKPIRSALQTTIIGAIASAAAYGIALAIQI